MKESRYNIVVEYNNQQLMFNSKTIATAVLNTPALDILNAVRKGFAIEETDLAKDMKRVGFLVDDDTDELLQLQMNYNASKYQKSGLSLTIAPTMACNFACPYCFEGTQTGIMSQELQNNIIKLVEEFAKSGQGVYITWFGGEPLLAKKEIYEMSEHMIKICQKEHVDYSAMIITNGYLLDEETIYKLKECKVLFAQITLDGLPQTHNQKRKLRNNSGEPTFEKIIENTILAKKNGIRTSIRVNVDKETATQLEPLLEMMMEKGLEEDLHLGHVIGNTDSCKEFCDACLSSKEFAQVSVDFEKLLFSKNLPTGYPTPTRAKCGADYIHGYVIDADGDMYKCWNEIGIKENSIGKLESLESFEQLLANANHNYCRYMTWSPFDFEKCRECKILPICMGGCQYNGRLLGEPICENWKYKLEEYIKLKCAASQ